MKFFLKNIKIEYENYEELIRILNNSETKTVTCINQYYFNLLYKNISYLNNLLKFDLIHPDGIGMKLVPLVLSHNSSVPYITGSDFYIKILEQLNHNKNSIILFGDKEEILKKMIEVIKMNYPKIVIKGFIQGYRDLTDKSIVNEINDLNASFLFVGLGAPRQEEWIIKNISLLNSKKIIAVGGWFRVLSNDRKRGPNWVQKVGLEWFVRLITEPRYVWKRYLFGIPLFFFRIVELKISSLRKYN